MDNTTDLSPASSFSYKALRQAQEIRLLRIPIDDDSQLITSSLFHASLDNCPPYTALSYVWGDAKTTLPISVNGSIVSITKNLHEALSALRKSGADTAGAALTLWVDALCINQSDDAEKAIQVQLMRRIYHEAAQVIIWLGPEGGESTAALHQLRDIGTRFQKLKSSPLYALRIPSFLQGIAATPGSQLRSVWYLFRRRPYWRRVWVIQEAVLARRATVWCGRDSVAWDVLQMALKAFQLTVSLPRAEATTTAALSIIADVNQDISHLRFCAEQFYASGEQGMGLMETLWWTLKADIQATDPRDRMYGLLGLIKEEDRVQIPIDYSAATTLENVLFEVTKALLYKHGPEILCYCTPSLTSPSLPTWVVDWTVQKETRLWTNRIGGAWTGDRAFNASKGMLWDSSTMSPVTHEKPTLSLPGVIVGSVRHIGPQFIISSRAPEYLQACREWLLEVKKMVSDVVLDSDALGDRLASLWRLPIADKNLAGGRAELNDEAPYHYELLIGLTSPELDSAVHGSGKIKTTDQLIIDQTLEYRRRWYLYDRRPFVTNDGHPGLALADAKPGDQLCIFAGASVPFVIRPNGEGGFRLVGESYVYGLMDGEALEGHNAASQTIMLT